MNKEHSAKYVLPVVGLILLVGAGVCAFQIHRDRVLNVQASLNSTQDFKVELGEEEYVMGPVSIPVDGPYNGAPVKGGVVTFSANGDTHRYTGSGLSSLTDQGVVLAKGPAGNFDECGAWLQSTHKITETHWVGWYHAEEKCNYSIGVTHKSMAFAESFDAGATWVKTDYPNNQVLTADAALQSDPSTDDAGDAQVIRSGDYFYMFYLTQNNWRYNIARSSVTGEGRPGTWYKYYNGAFTELGIGGHETPIDNLNFSSVSYNSYLDRNIHMVAWGRWGSFIYTSSTADLLMWSRFPSNSQQLSLYPQVSHYADSRVDNWSNRSANKQVYGYFSLMSPDGTSSTGQQFYIYYFKLFDGEDFTRRYLMRRRVVLGPADGITNATVALIKYQKQNPSRIKVSTEIAKPSEGYVKNIVLGSLLSYAATGYKPLYECYNSTTSKLYAFYS